MVAAWNGLLDRVKNAEAAATSAAAAPLRPEAEIGALVARLDELETELVRLQQAVDTGPAPAVAEHAAEKIADPWSNVPAAASVPVGLDPDWGAAQDFVPQRRIATWNVAGGILEPTALPPVDTAGEEVDAAFASLTGETAPGEPGGVPEWQAAGELFRPRVPPRPPPRRWRPAVRCRAWTTPPSRTSWDGRWADSRPARGDLRDEPGRGSDGSAGERAALRAGSRRGSARHRRRGHRLALPGGDGVRNVRTARDTTEMQGITTQAHEHLACLGILLQGETPPGVVPLKQAVGATRTLRGSASLLGLDPFQAFLGRLLQILEDVETGTIPWSSRIESALRELQGVESQYLEDLERGEPPAAGVEFAVEALPPAPVAPPLVLASSAGSPVGPAASVAELTDEIDSVTRAVAELRQALPASGMVPSEVPALAALAREIALLDACFRTPHHDGAQAVETTQEGLRNHCEGALHHLVEAAAQEVLDEARERGLRLALRVTGALDPIDEPLGAALLDILAHLWSDCLDVQAPRGETQIDTVLRCAEHRVVVEIRDGGTRDDAWRAARSDDDVLGRYPGLRRSRPLVEELDGLVEVEPEKLPGCRFRLTLPLATARPHVAILRVGQHDVALPASAVHGVHEAAGVHVAQDAAGPFVELEGARVPVLHLAFLLGDVSYDELEREQVVVVGSFERRAALFASNARRTAVGHLQHAPQGLWAGRVETDTGSYPLLHVGSLLGRCPPAAAPVAERPPRQAPAARRTPGTVLVVDSAAEERQQLAAALGGAGYPVRAVQTADEAWAVLDTVPVDLLLCDLRLPEMNAQQIAERRQHAGHGGSVPLVLILAHAGEQSHLVVQQLGAAAWVRSPVEPADLLEIVGRHVVCSSQVRIET